jgi:hypothetical protein
MARETIPGTGMLNQCPRARSTYRQNNVGNFEVQLKIYLQFSISSSWSGFVHCLNAKPKRGCNIHSLKKYTRMRTKFAGAVQKSVVSEYPCTLTLTLPWSSVHIIPDVHQNPTRSRDTNKKEKDQHLTIISEDSGPSVANNCSMSGKSAVVHSESTYQRLVQPIKERHALMVKMGALNDSVFDNGSAGNDDSAGATGSLMESIDNTLNSEPLRDFIPSPDAGSQVCWLVLLVHGDR